MAINTEVNAQFQSDSTIIHQVKIGENLYRISLKYNCSVLDLKTWNNIQDVNYVKAGQNLIIKIVTKSDTIEISKPIIQNPITLENIAIIDSIKTQNEIKSNISKALKKKEQIEENDLTFEGTKIIKDNEFESSGKTNLEAYLSTYYAYYNDSVGIGNYQKFPTSAPTSNRFSINMLMVKAKYNSNKLRGTFALHTGDIASSAWSTEFNFIQEANIGFKLVEGVWIDAGFFRTHLGVESIQPRENITTSISTTTYYEPYFLSGAKLTAKLSNKLTLQTGIFNGFNTFVETNSNKTFSFSAVYDANEHLSIVFNTLFCDETPDYQILKQPRIYNNLYFTYKSKKWDLGGEINYGLEQNAGLINTSETAYIFSSLLVSRYHFNKKLSIYGRGEYFLDRNEILTGPVFNSNHKLVGLDLVGGTGGFEFKPIYNSYLRIEWRRIITLESDEKVFYFNGVFHQFRDEIIASLGFWF